MKFNFYKFISFLTSLLDMFSGKYETRNPAIQSLKKDILFPQTPGNFYLDKQNLSMDIFNILGDLKKSFEDYKNKNIKS